MGAELKNVIVFALGGVRHAAELRWVREVVTLGFVTEIPTAPPGLSGAFNLRGNLISVLDLGAVMGGEPGPAPRQGDGALLVELDGVIAALRVDKVDEVATLAPSPDGKALVDGRGRTILLIDPPAILRRAVAQSQAVRGDDAEVAFDGRRAALDPTAAAWNLDGDLPLG